MVGNQASIYKWLALGFQVYIYILYIPVPLDPSWDIDIDGGFSKTSFWLAELSNEKNPSCLRVYRG